MTRPPLHVLLRDDKLIRALAREVHAVYPHACRLHFQLWDGEPHVREVHVDDARTSSHPLQRAALQARLPKLLRQLHGTRLLLARHQGTNPRVRAVRVGIPLR